MCTNLNTENEDHLTENAICLSLSSRKFYREIKIERSLATSARGGREWVRWGCFWEVQNSWIEIMLIELMPCYITTHSENIKECFYVPDLYLFLIYLSVFNWPHQRRKSTVSIVTGYGLNNQRFGVRVLMGARIFTSPCVHTGSEDPPSLFQWVPGALYGGGGGKVAKAWSWLLTSS
jgi:hypothetical protein